MRMIGNGEPGSETGREAAWSCNEGRRAQGEKDKNASITLMSCLSVQDPLTA